MLLKRVGLLLVISASILAAWLIYRNLIPAARALYWDESAHALQGLLLAFDIRQGDWVSLLYDTYRQVYWPPVHSWLAAFVFLAAGANDVTVRTIGVLCFIPLAPVLYLAARRLGQGRSELAGALAAWLTLTSPAAITWAPRCMIEVPALLALCATLLIYIKLLDEDASPRQYMLLGLAIVVTFLTRTNYAILFVLAWLVSQVFETGFRPVKLLNPRNLYAALPVVLGLGIWFGYPSKVVATWNALVNHPTLAANDPSPLFYPRIFVTLSGSVWMSAVYLAALVAGFRFWRNPKVRLLIALVLIQSVLCLVHQTKGPRYLLPVFPALILLAGHFGATWLNSASFERRALRRWAPRLVAAVACLYALTLPRTVRHYTAPGSDQNGATNYIGSILRKPGTAMVLGTRSICPPCLDWQLATAAKVLDPPQAGSMPQPMMTGQSAGAAVRSKRPRWLTSLVMPTFTRFADSGRIRTMYLYGFSPRTLRPVEPLFQGGLDRLVIVRLKTSGSATLLPALEPALSRASLKQTATREFGEHDSILPLLDNFVAGSIVQTIVFERDATQSH